MGQNVMPTLGAAITEQRSVLCVLQSSTDKVVAEFDSVYAALEYPPGNLPSGSKVVDAQGRVRFRLQRTYSAAGRPVPQWVLEALEAA